MGIKYRGVAQLVAREVWDFDAAGSNPVTPTKIAVLTAKIQSRKGSPCGFFEMIEDNMGNYTDIEKEFEAIIQPKLNAIFATNPNNTPQRQQQINATISQELFLLRTRKMTDLSSFTGRNVICYFSAFLQSSVANPELSINDNDINGFMNAISGMDKSKGLDLILHTPGGGVTATESIVTYLRKIFKMDIRVIVPHMAMSAGTMIACSSKEIVMGKQSSLGPIDPQYHNVPE